MLADLPSVSNVTLLTLVYKECLILLRHAYIIVFNTIFKTSEPFKAH